MDASFQMRAERLATEFASRARRVEDHNGMRRLMTKSTLERMLNSELDMLLGLRRFSTRFLFVNRPHC